LVYFPSSAYPSEGKALTNPAAVLDYAPIGAAAFAIPQFLPQIRKLLATADTAGVSGSWATLTSVNNAAWFTYFTLSGYWFALLPSSSATLLAGTLAVLLARRGATNRRAGVLILGWAVLLTSGLAVGGLTALGTLLTAAFVLQVAPQLWTAYRTARPTGISRGTWSLVLGELSCWAAFGVHRADPTLMVLGSTGVTVSVLMLLRIHRTSRIASHPTPPSASADATDLEPELIS
jgi:uncharacterized protein with PQ loop repeat